MYRILPIVTILAALLSVGAVRAADDPIHPASAPVGSVYLLSSDTVATDQNLSITRILRNAGTYPMTGIYFSENLPPEFSLSAVEVYANGALVNFLEEGPNPDEIDTGYNNYHWIVDSPDSTSTYQVTLNPGDSVTLILNISCSVVGDYALPSHSVAGYGNGATYFATSGPVTVAVVEPPDTTPPAQVSDLQGQLTTP